MLPTITQFYFSNDPDSDRIEVRDLETSPGIKNKVPKKVTDKSESAPKCYGKSMEDDLRQYIEHHKKLLKFSEMLNSLLSPIMFMRILTAVIVFGFDGFNITRTSDNLVLLRYIAGLSYSMLETGLTCWFASRLSMQSEMVGEGVYNSVWYDKPIDVQHSLKFIIMRSQRPVALSIGPFGTLSMNLFATILNSAYSYFTVLTQFQQK
ncbi:odorant receptor coreceptor-like [Cryptotermes secundus]|uniref:odorant receptor coreceptor-like n=1 Tax=Cryptotermes secundus TaxID=105785 RepID=UPI001454DA78|nr:odorant receptor coreceptor-like [Cryptotermes secundus]